MYSTTQKVIKACLNLLVERESLISLGFKPFLGFTGDSALRRLPFPSGWGSPSCPAVGCPLHNQVECKYPLFCSFLQWCLRWRVLGLAACVFFPCVIRFFFLFRFVGSQLMVPDGLFPASGGDAMAHLFFRVACCVPWFWVRLSLQYGGWSPRFFSPALPSFGLNLFVRSLLFFSLLLPLVGLHIASLDCGCGSHLEPNVLSSFLYDDSSLALLDLSSSVELFCSWNSRQLKVFYWWSSMVLPYVLNAFSSL